MTDPAIRVLLADDQPLVRAGLRMFLSAQPDIEVVAEAADGREAVDAAHEHRPDVVLMDVRMPNVDGVEATRLITAAQDAPRVLVLTTFDLDEIVYEALRAGASGFLLKDASEERLTTAIRVVADGGSMFAPSVTRRLIEEFARRPQQRVHNLDTTHRSREPGTAPTRPRPVQHRDSRDAVRVGEHRQDPRGPDHDETWAARPGPGGRGCLRGRGCAAT